jgi:hypothetical protein
MINDKGNRIQNGKAEIRLSGRGYQEISISGFDIDVFISVRQAYGRPCEFVVDLKKQSQC